MKPLEPPDNHYVLAAEGWLELGNEAEASKELEKVSPLFHAHPDVVRMRWKIYGKSQTWHTVLDIARTICRLEPIPLVQGAKSKLALTRAGSPGRLLTESIADRLPEFFAIPYNLACYACQLGHVKEAWDWFKMAVEMSDRDEILRLALNDPDLEPLWNRIRSI